MIGKPISEPVAATSRMPFSTDGLYSRGTLPPFTPSTNWTPEPRSPGWPVLLTRPNWPAPPHTFMCGLAHRAPAGDLERKRRRVNVGISAVGQRRGEIDDREADQRARRGHFANALFHRRDIFARHVAALHLVDELDARAALARLDGDLDPPELAGAARLLLVRIVDVDLLREAFAIDRKSTSLNSSH